jgi:hypothetical protein
MSEIESKGLVRMYASLARNKRRASATTGDGIKVKERKELKLAENSLVSEHINTMKDTQLIWSV